MQYVLVIHEVENYDKWKPFFDEDAVYRERSGSKGSRVFRSADNPDEIVILLEWDDLNNARKFFRSSDLMERMKRAGVKGKPSIYFLEDKEKTSA
jgi:heme-degrading monooxygenase HmoA